MMNSSFKRCINPFRLAFIGLLFLILYAGALIQLFNLQVRNNQFFNALADKQYKIKVTQTPPRAHFYDRNNQPLTLNKESYAAFITPKNLTNKQALMNFLKQNFPQAHERMQGHMHDSFMYIKRGLSEQEIETIKNGQLADIYLLAEPGRFYTVPSLGQTIGITDIDNKGISGLELIFNSHLTGKETTYILEKDARNNHFYFAKELASQGYDGQSITLTIDSDLQFLMYEELKQYVDKLEAQEGAVIIMDPSSGDILALASYPDFNPNEPMVGDLWRTKSRPITDEFEFGSVNKIFPAGAALAESVVTHDEIINCENREETYINGIKVTTWKACGELTYAEVIRNSNNIGTSKVALRLGKKLYPHLKKWGFTEPTGINFLGESVGFITPPSQWSKATPLSLSFGYEISSTLLQLARAFSLLCNDGCLITPRLVDNNQGSQLSEQEYTSEVVQTLRSIINLEHEGSTSQKGRIPGFTVMGKTGSAYLITNGTYDKSRSLYTFVGIIEKGNYKRIIALYVREPKPIGKKVYASTVAVPLFKNIAHNMIIHDKMV